MVNKWLLPSRVSHITHLAHWDTMNNSAPQDIPFIRLKLDSVTPNHSKISVIHYDKCSPEVICRWSGSEGSVIVPRPLWPFLVLLNCLNGKLDHVVDCTKVVYWQSLRLYLNTLVDDTLRCLDEIKDKSHSTLAPQGIHALQA